MYKIWFIIICGILLLPPAILFITDLIIKNQHNKTKKL